MNKKERPNKSVMGMSVRSGLLLIIVATLTLEVTSLIQYFYTVKSIRVEARLRAESELDGAKSDIMDVVNQTEACVRNYLWVAQWCMNNPDSIARVPQRLVQDNPNIMGSTLALNPALGGTLRAPYTYRDQETGAILSTTLATEAYNYPSKEWFVRPLELQAGYWSEPYFDEGGGNMLMITYSMPVTDPAGRIAAILTADISLDWLTELIGTIEVYPNSFNMVVSRTGRIMVCPVDSIIMTRSVDELAKESPDSAALNRVNRAMASGESGALSIRYGGRNNYVYYAPVRHTGWAISIILPEKEMFASVRKVGMAVKLLQIIGVLMLIIILRMLARNQLKYNALNDQKKRMESELHIGHEIQMSMIPKTLPAFPDRTDLDFAASIVPAKEVGGDLYDFYIRDEKLLFCIGDVSGKGVPASLVMAVTRSLFRAVSAHEFSPSRIVMAMNESMSDSNDNDMFVTFFCGTLDLATGHLRYCNAGHNPPLILTDNICELPVDPNIPLGVVKNAQFTEQNTYLRYDDALFLYTDGLTEAENATAQLFGLDRVEKILHCRRPSQAHLEAMQAAVNEFVGDAPQSDDLTMLFIHFLGHVSTIRERHVILHNDVQQIPQLADFIETVASEMQLSQSLAMGLNLALEEAVTNVIMYAYPKGADGLVDVEAIIREHSLEFIITDSGTPFDPTAAPLVDITKPASERPIGGLGIHLVRQLMDQVRYERRGNQNVLSMIKNI